MFHKTKNFHLVGIGGAGMSGIAEILLSQRYKVSGSDLSESPIISRLRELGAVISPVHRTENVAGADVLVYSSAIKADNPEVLEARRMKIPVIPRAEMLAELMRMKFSIAVAGTHGKTTTTSLAAQVLLKADLDPTTVIGGKLAHLGSGARLGKGDYLVAEADESDGSFLSLYPTVAIVTTIEAEHLDFYNDIEEIRETFIQFIAKVPFFGCAILNLDDENIRHIIPQVDKRYYTYGFTPHADLVGTDVECNSDHSKFNIIYKGEPLGSVTLKIPGKHNVSNSLACILLGLELDIPFETISAALSQCEGVERRMQIKGVTNGITVIDDYGHHPREVQVTLETIKLGRYNRLITLFQPHRFTRTQALWDDFRVSFFATDILYLVDIYPASEVPIAGITSERLSHEISLRGHKDVRYLQDREEIAQEIVAFAKPGDCILTLGAGNVWMIGERILELLEKENV